MFLIIAISLLTAVTLGVIAFRWGVEEALPFATFMIVLLPIECRIPLGAFELTAHRLILVVLTILYFVVGPGKTQSRINASTSMPLKWLMSAHVAWCLISTANSIVPIMSVKKLLSIVFEYYLLYFLYWKTVSKVQTINKILMAMVLALTACSVFGTFEAYSDWQVLSLLPAVQHRFTGLSGEADREDRVQSTFDHPILFGAALAMGITLALYLLTVNRKRWQKVLLSCGLLLMFLNIYKTSSRGPWLDVILGCALLVLGTGTRIRNRILVLVGLSVVVMLIRPGIWHTVEGIYENTMDTNTDTGASYEYRYALQRASLEVVSKNPARALWGYGLESFYDAGVEGNFLGKPHKFLSADDSWAELLVETGFIGLAIIAVLLLKPAFLALRDFSRIRPPKRYLSFVLLVNLLIFYFQMYSVGMYSWGQNGYMLWIVIALTLAYPKCRMADARALNSPSQARVFHPGSIESALQPS